MQILISSCILGNNVRWNGSNKRYGGIKTWAIENGFELVPVCPEHDLFGTPRAPIRLHQIADQIVGMMKSDNVYPELDERCSQIISSYPEAVGYIGIAGSPSCGISVGVKGRGSTIKGPMHKHANFPTVEINSIKTKESLGTFKKRIMKWINTNRGTSI